MANGQAWWGFWWRGDCWLWLPNPQETAILDTTQDRAQIETASESLQGHPIGSGNQS
ncbi:MAG UNVERIFIED_CONTAM: hypothetical protein LVT10_01985 [Anaerolineae bacterium]